MSSEKGLPANYYQVPRESVDVEALGEQAAFYMRIAEDAEVLSSDRTRRDQLYHEFAARAEVKPRAFAPENVVSFGDDPDVYLNRANS